MDANHTAEINAALEAGDSSFAIGRLVSLAESGDVMAIKDLAEDSFHFKDPELSARWKAKFEELVTNGNPQALLIRYHELLSAEEPERARAALLQAVELGSTDGMVELAYHYRNGSLGFPSSGSEYYALIQRAADAGSVVAVAERVIRNLDRRLPISDRDYIVLAQHYQTTHSGRVRTAFEALRAMRS